MTLSSRVNDLAIAVRSKFNAIFPKLVPEGGAANQVLTKNGTANHDVSWVTPVRLDITQDWASKQTFLAGLDVLTPTTTEVKIGTSATGGYDGKLTVQGGRTSSSTSEIASVNLRNNTSSAYDLVRLAAKDPDGAHLNGNGALEVMTASSGVLSTKFVVNPIGTVDFYHPITVQSGTVWHSNNDGSGSGLDADLLDGSEASAFARLTGATYSGGVVAPTFDGDGSLITGVNADSLDGYDSTDFARVGTASSFQAVHLTNADNAFSWENGVHWINGNDGGGNAQIRFGHNHGDLNGGGTGEVFTHAGTAYYLGGPVDSGSGTLVFKVASNGGAGVGEAVTWGHSLTIAPTLLTWGGDFSVTGSISGALKVPNGLGVGGAVPDATNTFAFYGTDLLLNSAASINMKYNKANAGDDASMTFQQGFTTHGLFGLLGNNDVTLKVGTGFTTAMIAKGNDGTVQFPEGVRNDALTAYKVSAQTLTTTMADIANWDDTHVAASGNLSWNATSGQAFVGKAGRFLVSYSITNDASVGSSRSESVVELQRWDGSSWTKVEGSRHLMYHRLAGRGGTAVGWSAVLDLNATDGLKLQTEKLAGNDTIITSEVMLSVLRL